MHHPCKVRCVQGGLGYTFHKYTPSHASLFCRIQAIHHQVLYSLHIHTNNVLAHFAKDHHHHNHKPDHNLDIRAWLSPLMSESKLVIVCSQSNPPARVPDPASSGASGAACLTRARGRRDASTAAG